MSERVRAIARSKLIKKCRYHYSAIILRFKESLLLPSRSYINLRRVSLGFAAQLILYLRFTVNMVPFGYNPALGAATLQLFVKWTTKAFSLSGPSATSAHVEGLDPHSMALARPGTCCPRLA